MLLKQKCIVEGGLALLATCARYVDLSQHAEAPEERRRAQLLLDLLTPVAKTFPAERGFESNALAVQVHGGYGYTSEYLPEAWLRDQKLNTIHEGTSGIQSLDLLGRKAVAEGGNALLALHEEIEAAAQRAGKAGVDAAWTDTRFGTVDTGRQDIVFTDADVRRSRSPAGARVLVAVGLADVAAAVAIVAVVRRGRRLGR